MSKDRHLKVEVRETMSEKERELLESDTRRRPITLVKRQVMSKTQDMMTVIDTPTGSVSSQKWT